MYMFKKNTHISLSFPQDNSDKTVLSFPVNLINATNYSKQNWSGEEEHAETRQKLKNKNHIELGFQKLCNFIDTEVVRTLIFPSHEEKQVRRS